MAGLIGHNASQRHVAVLFHPDRRPWLRPTMAGVNRYVETHADWRISLSSRYSHFISNPLKLVERPIDGVLAGAPQPQREGVLKLDCPKVLFGPQEAELGPPWVGPDYEAMGELGASYLIDKGYRNLCLFVHGGGERWIDLLARGFEQGAANSPKPHISSKGRRTEKRGTWNYGDQIDDLVELLESLDKPLGVLASDDEHGWRMIEAIRRTSLRCPRDVAVLSIGDDDFLCDTCRPTLSSIAIDYETIGFVAAKMLDDLMSGKPITQQQTVAPMRVITRGSTGHVAVQDPDLIAALKFISQNLDQPLTVDDIASEVLVSERTLLRKFKHHLGRTPSDQVRRSRIDRAKQLIIGTDMSFARIAVECGYGPQSALGRAVKQDSGLTPGELRRQYGRR